MMAIDERDRHRLHQRLDEVLGQHEAATLMGHLPPIGWMDVTTNQELASFRRELDSRFEAIDHRFEAVDRRFEAVDRRFDTLEVLLDTKLNALGSQLSAQLSDGLRDQLRIVVFTFVACLATFASAMVAAVKL